MIFSILKSYKWQIGIFILLIIGLFGSVGYFAGAYHALQNHTCEKPKPCPVCPPQTIFQITNEKVKAKNGGSVDITNLLKDNTAIQLLTDSLQTITKDTTTYKKKRGFFGRIFKKK